MSEPGGTRREDGGTRREEGSGEGLTRREGAGSTFVRVSLPAQLGSEFVVVGELASSGAEADVMLAQEVGSGRQVVVKLYRRGVAPDERAVERLAEASQPANPGWAHVVEVLRWGREEGCWFEVLEFCEHGSLRGLMVEGPRPELSEVIAEVSAALSLAHGLGLVHRDLKPENVLVRSVSPLDLVLGDFGLARALDASVRWTRAWGTPAYSPPELGGGEVSAAWDWWSLGMIVAELAGGRHPFELTDGTMMADQQIQSSLAQRPVDLSAVSDQRVALLCRGLLTRDRERRWGENQVSEWLAGRSPAVVADSYVPAGARTRSVLFGGAEFTSPVELAMAFQQHWGEAFRRLFEERDGDLVDELERLLRHHQLDEAVRILTPGSLSAAELPRLFADLLAEMDPQLDPIYNGVGLPPAGLEAAALEVIRAGGESPQGVVLDEVRRQNILTRWRQLPGMGSGPAVQDAWVKANAELETTVKELGANGYQPGPSEWAVARAWLLLCVLNPDHHTAQLAILAEGLDATYADDQPWWHALRTTPNPTPATLALTFLTHPVAVQQSHLQHEQARQEREAEQRHEAEIAYARRERMLSEAGMQDQLLMFTLADLSEKEFSVASPAIGELGNQIAIGDTPLMAWAIERPFVGLILACASGLLLCANNPPLHRQWWVSPRMVTRRKIMGSWKADDHHLALGLRDGNRVDIQLVEDEADELERAIESIRTIRSRKRLIESAYSWGVEE
jgi:hypothetical protein